MILEEVRFAAQLAAILEVSAKKPGNVSPENDFSDLTYEDFLLGSLAIGEGIGEAYQRGFLAGRGKISLAEIKIGELIKKCIVDVKSAHKKRNTHLGIVMLMVPIAAAYGLGISGGKLRNNIKKIVENSRIEDSLNFYEAIKIAKAGGLEGKLEEPKVTFYGLMKKSSGKDRIAEELVNGLEITSQVSRLLEKNFKENVGVDEGIVQTYLQILAKFPDTLIAKKVGKRKAQEVADRAKEIVNLGGVFTEEGKKEMEKFNQELRTEENELNPGTTADIIAGGIMLWLLKERF